MPDYSKQLARAIAAMTGTTERTASIVSLTTAPKRPRPVTEILDISDAFIAGRYIPADQDANCGDARD